MIAVDLQWPKIATIYFAIKEGDLYKQNVSS